MNLSEGYLMDLTVRMAHHSTAIEGNSLTLGETKSILVDNYIPRAMSMRELHEVLNYKAFAPFLREKIEQQTPLSLDIIKRMHIILCQDAIEYVPGQFKQRPNVVVGADFTPTPPYLVPTALQDWLLNDETQLKFAASDQEKILAICRQHIAFEHIHPFPDGNGRVGRAIMVYDCLAANMPPVVIPVERKAEYINFLNREDINGFAKFAAELQTIEQERMMSDFV